MPAADYGYLRRYADCLMPVAAILITLFMPLLPHTNTMLIDAAPFSFYAFHYAALFLRFHADCRARISLPLRCFRLLL